MNFEDFQSSSVNVDHPKPEVSHTSRSSRPCRTIMQQKSASWTNTARTCGVSIVLWLSSRGKILWFPQDWMILCPWSPRFLLDMFIFAFGLTLFVSNAATRHSLIRRGAWCAFCLFLPCNWHGKILCMKYTDSNLEEYAFQPVVADWQIETDQMTCKTSDTYFSLPRNLCVDLCHTSYYLYYCYYCVSESFKIVDRCEELRKDQKGVKECHEVCWPMSNQALFQGISSPWTIWEFSIFHPCWLFWNCQDFDAEPFLHAKCREVLNWKLAFRQLWAPRNSIAYLGAIQFIVPWWPHL